MGRWKTPVAVLLFGLGVCPLGALLAKLLWGADVQGAPTPGLEVAAYGLATTFALIPLAAFAALAVLLFPRAQGFAPLRRMLQTGAVVFPLLSLAAQLYCWRWLASDAQAPVLFAVVPLYAGAASAVLMLLVFVAYLVPGLPRRRPAQG
jgi:hypothetical protein